MAHDSKGSFGEDREARQRMGEASVFSVGSVVRGKGILANHRDHREHRDSLLQKVSVREQGVDFTGPVNRWLSPKSLLP